MAFESRVYALRIEQHPNADRLELAAIGGFRCVVGKGSFVDGDLAAYIPEAAVCPDWLIAELGLEGKLAGSKKNRVKAVKLRGSLSQGLVYPVCDGMIRGRQVAAGDDVTELLELVKYEPPIPISMQGEVRAAHGATAQVRHRGLQEVPGGVPRRRAGGDHREAARHLVLPGLAPRARRDRHLQGHVGQGLALKLNDANEGNLYVRTWSAHQEAFESARVRVAGDGRPCYVLGEVYGRGVQDLHYGKPNPDFAVFDAYVGEPGTGRYLNPDELAESLSDLFPLVPVLYSGSLQSRQAAGTDRRRHHARRRARARRRGREAGRRARIA